jgi:hypothetical protein
MWKGASLATPEQQSNDPRSRGEGGGGGGCCFAISHRDSSYLNWWNFLIEWKTVASAILSENGCKKLLYVAQIQYNFVPVYKLQRMIPVTTNFLFLFGKFLASLGTLQYIFPTGVSTTARWFSGQKCSEVMQVSMLSSSSHSFCKFFCIVLDQFRLNYLIN